MIRGTHVIIKPTQNPKLPICQRYQFRRLIQILQRLAVDLQILLQNGDFFGLSFLPLGKRLLIGRQRHGVVLLLLGLIVRVELGLLLCGFLLRLLLLLRRRALCLLHRRQIFG